MGFMRRFDRGFAAAKQRLDEGAIGDAVVFKSTSRDPYRPSIEYADPRTSGGLIIDMGIHDFDLARWYMGDVAAVQAVGGLLAYPELGSVGDIDNAIISLIFTSGRLGVVDITRNGIYGYDINAELLGTKGTLKVGYLRETPVMVMTKGQVAHDTVPFFMERFGDAYAAQLENFAQNVLHHRDPPVTVDDGVEALRVAIAATRAQKTGQRDRLTAASSVKSKPDQPSPKPGPLTESPSWRQVVSPMDLAACCSSRRAEGADRNGADADAAARRLAIRWLCRPADRGRPDLERPDRRRRGVSRAAGWTRVDQLVRRSTEERQTRPAPRRVLGLPARGVSAAPDGVRGDARSAAPRSPNAARRRRSDSRRG